MKSTAKALPRRSPLALGVEKFGTLNVSTHISSLELNNFSRLINVVKEGNRLVPRIGAKAYTETTDYASSLISSGSVEWIYRKDITVPPYTNSKALETTVLFGNVVLCGSKAYVLGSTNTVWQRMYNAVTGVGYNAERKMGISAPKVASYTDLANAGMEGGYYVWGFEFVQKVGDVVSRRSGVRRVLRGDVSLTDRPTDVFKHYCLSEIDWVLSSNHADGTAISTDTSWTHVRMYRSKMISDNDENDTGIGSPSELYLVLERTRAAWIADSYKMNDTLADVLIDDSTIVLIDGIDLLPLPSSGIGCAASGRIVLAGDDIKAADGSPTRILFSNPIGSAYDEVYAPLTNYLDCSTDGTPIQALFSVNDDLIVIKQNETGIVRGGNPANGYNVIDSNTGVKRNNLAGKVVSFARYIEGLGIFAINTDGEIRLFDLSLRWTKYINGFDFSSPVSDVFKTLYLSSSPGNFFEVKYHNGMVFFNFRDETAYQLASTADLYKTNGVETPSQLFLSRNRVLVLDLRSELYWTEFQFPIDELFKVMFKDHNDNLYLANTKGMLNISQYMHTSFMVDQIPELEGNTDTEFPVITLMQSGTASSNEGFYELRGMNLRASFDLNGFVYFDHFGLNTSGGDVDAGTLSLKKVKTFSYDDETSSTEDLKNIHTDILGCGRSFAFTIHSASNLQIETVSFDGIQQDRVRGDFDPMNKNQAMIDSMQAQDQIFWMSRPNPLKSNSHRASPIVEVAIV